MLFLTPMISKMQLIMNLESKQVCFFTFRKLTFFFFYAILVNKLKVVNMKKLKNKRSSLTILPEDSCNQDSLSRNLLSFYGSQFLEIIYSKIFTQYIDYLENELTNCKSVLDIGCSAYSPIRFLTLSFSYSVGVDLCKTYIKESKQLNIHDDYVYSDIRHMNFKENSFDVVLALDVLEHLRKEEGSELIENMEKWAKRKIIVFTTNGFVEQDEYDENPFQHHKSGWDVYELKAKGFKVHGMNGWYALMGGYRGGPRFRPKSLWKVVSDFSQKFVYNCPNRAFQLLCVKEKILDQK